MNCFWVYLYFVICCVSENISAIEEYFWRDYHGDIPYDAVPGGKNSEGRTTYIGQAIQINGVLIPGQIDPTQRKLYYYYDSKGYPVSRNVKILCSPYLNQFQWIKTDNEGLRYLTQKHLVPGGFDDNYPLLIGRASIDDEVIVGKITIYRAYEGFTYATASKTSYQASSYEVLTYNPRCVKIDLFTK